MEIKGLTHLSKEDIETKTGQILLDWFPQVLKKPMATPLGAFCEKLQNHKIRGHNIRVVYDADLGENAHGQKILGCFSLDPATIFIDSSLENDIRFPFVLAHEIGHLILHRNINFKKEDYDKLKDTEFNIYNKNKKLDDNDWMEWQANSFASSLLMPQKTFQSGLVFAQKSIGINRVGLIYLSKEKSHQQDFNKTVEAMAKLFKVSKTNITYRLKSLNLIDGEIDTGHISEYLTSL